MHCKPRGIDPLVGFKTFIDALTRKPNIMTLICLKNNREFTLNELLAVTFTLAIPVAIAVPKFIEYRTRSFDANTKINLVHLFTTCKAYCTEKDEKKACNLKTITNNSSLGYNLPPGINLEIGNGRENKFSATAQHKDSSRVFNLDQRGRIT